MRKKFRYMGYIFRDCHNAFPAFYAINFIMYAISITVGVLGPLLLAHILELAAGIEGSSRSGLAGAIMLYGVCIGVPPVIGVVLRSCYQVAEVRGKKYFGNQLFAFSRKIRLEALENPDVLDRFYSADKGGTAQFQFMDRLILVTQSIILCIGTVIVVGRYSPILIFTGLIELFPDIFTKLYFEKRLADFRRIQIIASRRCSYFLKLLTRKESIKELRVMGAEQYMKEKWVGENTRKLQGLREVNLDICRKQVYGIIVINACYAFNIGLAFYLMIRGEISIGAFAACLSAFTMLHSNLGSVVSNFAEVVKQYYVVEEYYDYFTIPTEENGTEIYQPFHDKILAEDVHFSYSGSDGEALSGLSLEIGRGEHVVIVGENGSGKTTFSKILTGAYLPSQGSVAYDGHRTEELNRKSLYDRISMVQQDFVHYHFTLRENIGIGNLKHMDDTGAMKALLCRVAGEEFLDKTGGLDVQLGREFGGQELSGGEWQKVAIARGLWKDSDIIILDEPASALDPLAEYDILSKLVEMIRGKTSVIISHRVGICRTADRIIVMKGGRMVESGRHEELLQAGGEYAHIWKEQAKWYQ